MWNLSGKRVQHNEVAITRERLADLEGQIAAIGKSQAVIEFALDGTVLAANDNFLKTLGYTLDEVRGRHHRQFVEPGHAESAEYRAFWTKLGRGEYDAGQYKRVAKGGREIWIQASYNPVFDAAGRPAKVVKYATDITEQKRRDADMSGQMAALDKAQAIIEFTLDGRVLNANANFLATLGYTLDEVRGQHHRLFVEPSLAESTEYRAFWAKLGRGEYDAARYKRVAKGGREVWIQASYNPIFDASGQPYKVVKYATDITAQVLEAQALERAVQQVRDLVAAAKAGDLTKRVPMDGKSGSIELLCGGINELVDSIASIVGQVKVASHTVSAASREIAAGNGDLSARTESQAASLEETAASMEELTSTVKANAENARQASQLAASASDIAQQGGAVVGAVVGTMADISQASRKIAEIIGTIDGIAFQTNILALNAAVEAARAGEQGRGFAVVASEVRSLAQRAAGAAREIKTLIGNSVEKVDVGTKLVDQAGKTMDDIVNAVKRVTAIMGEISAASQEQSSGIEQVNQAITQMDEATQQNAALVEEVSASARSLQSQAGELSALVEHFVFNDAPSANDAGTPRRTVTEFPAKRMMKPGR